jgi:hypothetical protein
MVFCCISSSSVPWWTSRVPSGDPPLAPISRNCRYYSPRVFALLPVRSGTLVTGKFTMIWESPTSPTISDLWEIRLVVRWCGEPLSWAPRQTYTLTKRRPGSPKTGKTGSATCPGYPQVSHAYTLKRANWHVSTTLRVSRAFSSVVSQMSGYNSQRRGTVCTLPKLGDKIFTRLVHR